MGKPDEMGYSRKKAKQGGPIFLNPLDFLVLHFYPWKFSIKHSINPENLAKLLHNLEIPRPKTRIPGISAWIFLNTPEDFTSFLIDS